MTRCSGLLAQNPTENQQVVAEALGLPAHRVFSHAKRLGGGFGGKEILPSRLSGIAAVAAWKARRPVRLCLDRDEDMHISGQRHAFLANYKVRTGGSVPIWCCFWFPSLFLRVLLLEVSSTAPGPRQGRADQRAAPRLPGKIQGVCWVVGCFWGFVTGLLVSCPLKC